MRALGYSTGAIALGDFRRALALLSATSADAVELSALRASELVPLLSALDDLDLSRFRHVALHAPSSISETDEAAVVDQLRKVSIRGIFVVVHPDTMHRVERWTDLGEWLCVENMDNRKHTGRSANELRLFFNQLPRARLCFDIAHARQYDSSMTEAYSILAEFSDRVSQIHISEVKSDGSHRRVSPSAAADYAQVASMIPQDAAVIVEARVRADEIATELSSICEFFYAVYRDHKQQSAAPLNANLRCHKPLQDLKVSG